MKVFSRNLYLTCFKSEFGVIYGWTGDINRAVEFESDEDAITALKKAGFYKAFGYKLVD